MRELPPEYHDETRKAWNEKAEAGWGELGEPSPEFLDFYQKYKEELGHTVLDIGSGKGRYLAFLAKEGFDVTGLELSDKMIAAAEEKLAEQELHVQIIQGKSSELPFTDGQYDFVLSVGAIHHNTWPDIQKSFSEAARVLKPGQLFLFQGRSEHDTSQDRQHIDDTGMTAVDTSGSKEGIVQHYFSREELDQLATENNLAIVDEPHEVLRQSESDPERTRARWWVTFRKHVI